MNHDQILEQLSQTDAYAPGLSMPLQAWSRDTALREIERRITMDTRDSRQETTHSTGRDSGSPSPRDIPKRPQPIGKPRRWSPSVVAAATFAVIAVALGVVLLLTQTGSDDTPPATAPTEPGAVIEHFYQVLLDDLDAAVALFAEDAVMVPDLPTLGGVIEGREAIRNGLRGNGSLHPMATAEMESVELTRIEVDGNTVTFDDSAVTRNCLSSANRCIIAITGHVAAVEDGKIVKWEQGSIQELPANG